MTRIRTDMRKPPKPEDSAPRPARTSRKPLRKVSKERAKLMRQVGPGRRAFLEAVGVCMFDGCTKPACDPHEIASGHAREECLRHLDMQMALCRKHHDVIQGWKPVRQIAALVWWEIEQRCLKFCEIKGLAPTAVLRDEVVQLLMFRNLPKVKKVK